MSKTPTKLRGFVKFFDSLESKYIHNLPSASAGGDKEYTAIKVVNKKQRN